VVGVFLWYPFALRSKSLLMVAGVLLRYSFAHGSVDLSRLAFGLAHIHARLSQSHNKNVIKLLRLRDFPDVLACVEMAIKTLATFGSDPTCLAHALTRGHLESLLCPIPTSMRHDHIIHFSC
jgi:hypothetical protein